MSEVWSEEGISKGIQDRECVSKGEFMLEQRRRSTRMVSLTVLDCQNSGRDAKCKKTRKTAAARDSSSQLWPFKRCLEIFYLNFWRLLCFVGKGKDVIKHAVVRWGSAPQSFSIQKAKAGGSKSTRASSGNTDQRKVPRCLRQVL